MGLFFTVVAGVIAAPFFLGFIITVIGLIAIVVKFAFIGLIMTLMYAIIFPFAFIMHPKEVTMATIDRFKSCSLSFRGWAREGAIDAAIVFPLVLIYALVVSLFVK